MKKLAWLAALVAAGLPALAYAQSTRSPTLVGPVYPPELGIGWGQAYVSGSQVTGINVWGYTADCDSGEEAVWALGADYNFIQTADEIRIKASGDAADTSNGAGAREIVVEGLNSSWDPISEVIQTQGANVSVKTTQQFIRLNRAYVRISGAYGAANTGDIDIETETGTQIGIIPATLGELAQAVYSVPDGYTAYIMSFGHNYDVQTDGNGDTVWAIRVRKNADDATVPVTPPLTPYYRRNDPNGVEFRFASPIAVPARSDVWVTCAGAASGVHGSATLGIYLAPDTAVVNATPTPTPMPSPTQSPTPTPTP